MRSGAFWLRRARKFRPAIHPPLAGGSKFAGSGIRDHSQVIEQISGWGHARATPNFALQNSTLPQGEGGVCDYICVRVVCNELAIFQGKHTMPRLRQISK